MYSWDSLSSHGNKKIPWIFYIIFLSVQIRPTTRSGIRTAAGENVIQLALLGLGDPPTTSGIPALTLSSTGDGEFCRTEGWKWNYIQKYKLLPDEIWNFSISAEKYLPV